MPDNNFEKFSAEFAKKFGSQIEEKAKHRTWAKVELKKIIDALDFSKKGGYTHLSTITALDTGSEFEVIYHLVGNDRVFSVKTMVDRGKAKMPTCISVFPGAILYERENHDLFGILFEGHPDLRPLVLPEGWPEDEHPLRKDWTAPDGGEK